MSNNLILHYKKMKKEKKLKKARKHEIFLTTNAHIRIRVITFRIWQINRVPDKSGSATLLIEIDE